MLSRWHHRSLSRLNWKGGTIKWKRINLGKLATIPLSKAFCLLPSRTATKANLFFSRALPSDKWAEEETQSKREPKGNMRLLERKHGKEREWNRKFMLKARRHPAASRENLSTFHMELMFWALDSKWPLIV